MLLNDVSDDDNRQSIDVIQLINRRHIYSLTELACVLFLSCTCPYWYFVVLCCTCAFTVGPILSGLDAVPCFNLSRT